MKEPVDGAWLEAELGIWAGPGDGAVPTVRRYRGLQAGGGDYEERPAVRWKDCAVAKSAAGWELSCWRDGATVEADVTALGMPANWEGLEELVLEVENGEIPLVVRWSLVGARGRLIGRTALAAGQRRADTLSTVEIPLGQGMQPAYEPSAVRLEVFWGDRFATEGERVAADAEARSRLEPEREPVRLVVRRLAARRGDARSALPLVNRFGQRVHADWPEKLRAESELRERRDHETVTMEGFGDKRTRFGGFVNSRGGGEGEATGFFGVRQDEAGRWWFQDPEGHPFWSVGVTGVRLLDTTIVEGREDFFEALPDADGPHGAACNPPVNSPANNPRSRRAVGFYYWNVLRKYGQVAAWRDRVLGRLRSWGINTLGNWSELEWFQDQPFPFTVALSTRFDDLPRIGRFSDIFADGWEAAFRKRVEAMAGPLRQNPWLVGYFVDNELPWRNLGRLLAEAPAESAVKRAWVQAAVAWSGGWEGMGKLLGTAHANETSLAGWKPPEKGVAVPEGVTALLEAGAAWYAEEYFRKVREVVKAVDPNHLYMGCRFVRQRPSAEICRTAGRYCDVVTVNSYALWPRQEQFGEWHALTGRPILIGEHHFPLWSERQLPPVYPAFTAAERERFYEQLLRKWAEQPWSVGSHWYQFCDQPLTGRPSDGENQPVGLVDITDTPHPELVAALAKAVPRIEEWHAGSGSAGGSYL